MYATNHSADFCGLQLSYKGDSREAAILIMKDLRQSNFRELLKGMRPDKWTLNKSSTTKFPSLLMLSGITPDNRVLFDAPRT
ncbi:hypothetical protein EJB05_31502 [Eragrostis curvula]|uniref:Uncharacterized protein n=1 Tax=Eragrostis curvula TaxID=38414 RepID=A0A5J9UEH2_9POAL|nr:hypothetical protein EJB05_50957 [Eragrostis curvula]TVU21834.1 hypothetical protein EJB05_31502 [Eragrostis curvula]